MAKFVRKPVFKGFLGNLQSSRMQADAAIASIIDADNPVGKNLSIAWEILFDHLSQRKPPALPLADLNTAAGIVYKLVQSIHQLNTVEEKVRAVAALQAQLATATEQIGLPPELREKLERDLNLI